MLEVMGHMNIKRIIHRVKEEVIATKDIAEITSWTEAINTFRSKIDVQIMNRNGYQEPEVVRDRLMKRHDTTLRYIEYKYKSFLDSYDYLPELKVVDNTFRDKVWVCWWQGIENSPQIVKRCVESIQRNSPNHEVIIVTEDNYHQFVDFPEWLEEKKKKGIISRTHYSDLLRLEILANYGGVWLDSTFFCVKPCIDELFDLPVWSIKRPDYLHCSIACGYFANYSLGCTFENRRVYAVIRDFLLHYWKENDGIIDYLLTDYLIVLAQKNDCKVNECIKSIRPNNPLCDELFKVLGNEYDENLWNELKKDTGLFKLSWKHEFPLETNGKKTFYSKLLDGTL